jgi:colanic acid biosynthesis protein WcaH
VRKAKEEVGIDCNVGPIIHTAETIFPDGPQGISVHSINSCFFMYPKEKISTVALDNHQEDYRWTKYIFKGLHPYVERCLLGAGLDKKKK